MRKLVILNVAALSPRDLGTERTPRLNALIEQGSVSPLIAPEPALTCPSHATMVTGLEPREHGIVSNGWYERAHGKVFNWGRSDRLVAGEKIWESLANSQPGARTVNLFWRYCTHANCALTMTERPTYFSNGRKGADVYSSDGAFKATCVDQLGAFPFFHFWGPKANLKSSEWILGAARLAIDYADPDLLLCYAPGLDYDIQRFGPSDERTLSTLAAADALYGGFIETLQSQGRDVMVVADYGFTEAQKPVFVNRALREAGLLAVDAAANGEWLEPGASRAFAVCDNQVAHVYIEDVDDVPHVKKLLAQIEGVAEVLGPNPSESEALGHARSGQLLVIADPGSWFAYPYWLSADAAPDFAACVDIFNKPGFDPCELLLRPGAFGGLHAARRFVQMKTGIRAPFDVISTDPAQIKGTRNVRPSDPMDGAALITSWPRDAGIVPMVSLKQMVLERMLQA